MIRPDQTTRRAFGPVAVALFSLGLGLGVALPTPAEACGGLFCSSLQPIVVEQSAERILFEVHGDGTVTTHVDIAYRGAPESFSWILPVPSVPELDVLPPSTLRLLALATAPYIVPPPLAPPESAGDDDDTGDDDDDFAGDDDDAGDDNVDVIDLPVVGPYDPEVISSDNATDLANWLFNNDYLVTQEMLPYLEAYVAAGMSFLGLKLAPDAGVQEIAPISITYEAEAPMVPLALTAVAAVPEMEVLVFVLGDTRYQGANYTTLDVPHELVMADPRNGVDNYAGLVSYLADESGGRAFVTEWSAPASEVDALTSPVPPQTSDWAQARAVLRGWSEAHEWVTRLYTRISPTEMGIDPVFEPVTSDALSRAIDLSGRPEVPSSYGQLPPARAATLWCGAGVSAWTSENREACRCDEGFVARSIFLPDGTPSVTCQDGSFDLMASMEPNPDAPAPCPVGACGDGGSCVVLGGRPTCDCADGFAAAWAPGSTPICQAIDELFPRVQILWPEWNPDLVDDSGCNMDDLPDGVDEDDLPDGVDEDDVDDALGDGGPGPGSCGGCSTQVSRARRGAVAPTFFASLLLVAAGVGLRRRR